MPKSTAARSKEYRANNLFKKTPKSGLQCTLKLGERHQSLTSINDPLCLLTPTTSQDSSKMYDLNKICFMCLNGDISLKVVFHTQNDTAAQIKYILPELTIFNPEIPVYICSLCCTSLHSFYTFKKMCLVNYTRLLQNTKALQRTGDTQEQIFSELQISMIKQEQKENDETLLLPDEQVDQRTAVEDHIEIKEEFVSVGNSTIPECSQQIEFLKCESVSYSEQDDGCVYNNSFDTDKTDNQNLAISICNKISENPDLLKQMSYSYSTPKSNIFDKSALRRIVISIIVTEKKAPTVCSIHTKFREDFGYKGDQECLRKALHDLGFRWRKTKTDRKILIERNDIRSLRLNFLRNIKRYREENRPIIYMNETYIHTLRTHTKSCDDNSNEDLLKQIEKGNRLIIVHAGGENGFVQNSYLKDYHDEINFKNYKKWLQNKLIPKLPPRSVLVIDNSPYHTVQIEKCPSSNSRKDVMTSWLIRKNIPFTDDMLKPDLYALIKLHKPHHKNYEIDNVLLDKGHNVLRLPPYHSDLNPIELVWAALNQYVAQKNVNFSNKDTERFCDEFFESFSADEWKLRCEHAKKIEEFFITNEPNIDLIVDKLIINLGDDDSESETSNISDTELSDIEELE